MSIDALNNITTAEVKAYHGYTSTDKDSIITVIRPLVADEIESHCRHDFLSTARTSEKPSVEFNRTEFYVKFWPVDLGQTFTLVEDGETLVRNTDYYVDGNTGRVWKIRDPDSVFQNDDFIGFWSTQSDGIVVTYTGGVALSGAQDVVMVFYEMVGIRSGIKKRTFVDNIGIEQTVFVNSIPLELKKILDKYKHRRITSSGN